MLRLSVERINVNNQQQRQELRQLLREAFGEARGNEIGAFIPPRARFDDVFDFALDVRLTPAEFEEIEKRLSAEAPDAGARGKVNINQAPREVLLCLGNLEPGDIDALLARRESAVAAKPDSIAWVLDTLREKARGLGNQIIGRGGQYSADIVAVSGDGRAFKRVRIVVDATGTSAGSGGPRIVYRRDLTDGGWPLDPSILESLRAGGSVDERPVKAGRL